jgi:hypothetical protein
MGTTRPSAGDLAAVPVPWCPGNAPGRGHLGHFTVACRESGCRSVGTTSRRPGREGPGQVRGFCWPGPYPPMRAVWIGSGRSRQSAVLPRYFIARYGRSPSMPPAMAYGRFGLPRHDPRLAYELGRVLVRLGQRDLLAGARRQISFTARCRPVCRSRPRCTSPIVSRASGLTSSNRPAIASAPFLAAFCFVICHLVPDAEPGRLFPRLIFVPRVLAAARPPLAPCQAAG